MMTLLTSVVRHGSTNFRLLLTTERTVHQCAKRWNLGNFVQIPRRLEFLKTSSASSSLRNCRSVSSTSMEKEDNDSHPDKTAPVEFVGDVEEFTLALTDEEIQELSGGDPEIIKKIRYIQLEHEIYKQEGIKVPLEPIKLSRWDELLALRSKSKRLKYYEFMFKLEKKAENDKRRHQLKKEKRLEKLAQEPPVPPLGEDPDGMIYGLNRNTLFLRLYEQTENRFFYNRIMTEAMFSQPFILDCDYDRYMSLQEAKNCAKQIEYIFSINRIHPQPFNLHIVNAKPNDVLISQLHQRIPILSNPEFPMQMNRESYLDLYPKNKLVYLTPHARDELLEFNHDDIYILGCNVDKSDPRPLSAAKAKREKIRTQRLPLERYLDWGMGNKCLTLNQITAIMLDQRYYKDWNKALEHVPRRKLRGWCGRGLPIQHQENRRSFMREDGTTIQQQENRRSFTREDGTYKRKEFKGIRLDEDDLK